MGWTASRRQGDAKVLHDITVPPGWVRSVSFARVTGGAVVLGSTQPLTHVDHDAAARAGLDVVRRRSGGGAVLVEPGQLVWVDLVLPRGDPLWDDDVGAAFRWVGQAWVGALSSLGVAGAEVHRDGLVTSRWSSRVCFAGLGPGEVTLEGRKVVGMAQRRTHHGALFHCAVPLLWQPRRLLDVMALTPAERSDAERELADAVAPVHGVEADDVEEALLDHLLGGW